MESSLNLLRNHPQVARVVSCDFDYGTKRGTAVELKTGARHSVRDLDDEVAAKALLEWIDNG